MNYIANHCWNITDLYLPIAGTLFLNYYFFLQMLWYSASQTKRCKVHGNNWHDNTLFMDVKRKEEKAEGTESNGAGQSRQGNQWNLSS